MGEISVSSNKIPWAFFCNSAHINESSDQICALHEFFRLMQQNDWTITRGGCRGLPLLPMQHPEMAHINFQSSVFVSKKTVNKILKPDRK